MSRRGMHHHSLRLVDDKQIAVLIYNLNRDVLRYNVKRLRIRHINYKRLPAAQAVIL